MPTGPFGVPRITDWGPFVEADVTEEDISVVADITEGSVSEAKRANIEEMLAASSVCDNPTEFTKELMIRNPQENATPIAFIDSEQIERDPFSEIAHVASGESSRLGINQAIAVHTTPRGRARRIKERGFMSRKDIGIEPKTGSVLRNESAYMHGNIQAMSRLAGFIPGGDRVPIISIINTEEAFWGSVTMAQGLGTGLIDEEKYMRYGVAEYEELVSCPFGDSINHMKGAYFPYNLPNDDNIQEFAETAEVV